MAVGHMLPHHAIFCSFLLLCASTSGTGSGVAVATVTPCFSSSPAVARRSRGEIRCQLTAAERLQKNEPVLKEISARLEKSGLGKAQLVQDKSIGPGLTNAHYRFETNEASIFCKVTKRLGAIHTFEQEYQNLQTLAATGTVRVPTPLSYGLLSDGHSFLALEYMESVPFGPSIKSVARGLGEDLARLHMHPVPFMGHHYGFQSDNFLGMAPQKNEWMDSFSEFFIQRRLLPQLLQAGDRFNIAKWNQDTSTSMTASGGGSGGGGGGGRGGSFDRLLKRVEEVLEPVAHVTPSLLHGDLWQGNSGALKDGRRPWMHDPACWYGHSEFDLAISSLFGSFLPDFYDAYHSLIPKTEGFESRQEIYKLYFHLLHLNMYGAGFGSAGSMKDPKGYYERVLSSMRRICQKQ